MRRKTSPANPSPWQRATRCLQLLAPILLTTQTLRDPPHLHHLNTHHSRPRKSRTVQQGAKFATSHIIQRWSRLRRSPLRPSWPRPPHCVESRRPFVLGPLLKFGSKRDQIRSNTNNAFTTSTPNGLRSVLVTPPSTHLVRACPTCESVTLCLPNATPSALTR